MWTKILPAKTSPPIRVPTFWIIDQDLNSSHHSINVSVSSSLQTSMPAIMASTRPLVMLMRTRPTSRPVSSLLPTRTTYPSLTTAPFSSSAHLAATPAGPPPQGFRLPRKERWDESKESALDKAGKYFLFAEMVRGMWVVLEQFFRPPCVILCHHPSFKYS